MSKPTHTPGPWVLELQEVRPHRIVIRAGDREILSQDMYAHSSVQRTLADCLAAIGFPAAERASIIAALQEQVANARLIAAAPDLLEALNVFAGRYACPDSLSDGATMTFTAADIRLARAAIAKASGPPTSSREP